RHDAHQHGWQITFAKAHERREPLLHRHLRAALIGLPSALRASGLIRPRGGPSRSLEYLRAHALTFCLMARAAVLVRALSSSTECRISSGVAGASRRGLAR